MIGAKTLFVNKLFSFFAATMASSGFCPYHSMWHEDARSKWIGAIPTPWVMMIALGLGVLTTHPELYHAYGRVTLLNFLRHNIDDRCLDRQQ
jgi:hypothetical protein